MKNNNRLEKKLPIVHPPIIGFLHHAYDLEVLLTQKVFLPAFYMDYISLNFLKKHFEDRDSHYLDFCGGVLNKYIKEHYYSRNDIYENETDLCEHITSYINEGWYVQVVVDEFSIPDRLFYKKYHFFHAMQIYGYDKDKFYASGFRANNTYGNHMVLFEDFKKAMVEEEGYTIRRASKENTELNTMMIRTKLLEYLNAENLSIKYAGYSIRHDGAGEGLEFYWGIDVYEGLLMYINLLNRGQTYFDIRPWHILWEHKECMLKRMKYLTDARYVDLESQHIGYNEIAKMAHVIRNKMLKYKMTGDKKLLTDVVQTLKKIRSMEMREIETTVKKLE